MSNSVAYIDGELFVKDALKGLWILDTSGLCLLHRNYEAGMQVDETIFGGFLTAILSFTQDMVNDKIESITMSAMEIYYQSFGSFAVAVSVDKSKKVKKLLPNLITKIGNEFKDNFENALQGTVQSTKTYEPFGNEIDVIFGLKGHKAQGDSEILLDILKGVKEGKIPEAEAIQELLDIYEELDSPTQRFMATSMKDLEKIFKKSPLLTKEQQKKFQEIIKNVSAQMKAEKWLSSF
ncbi:MAG: hypothetical protein ACXAC7_16295 [Candidatus Hodarchaeales archaeon]|jgi:hypothetical protein